MSLNDPRFQLAALQPEQQREAGLPNDRLLRQQEIETLLAEKRRILRFEVLESERLIATPRIVSAPSRYTRIGLALNRPNYRLHHRAIPVTV